MAWIKPALARKELEIGEHQKCPHYHPRGEALLNACEKHKYVYKIWFEMRFPNLLVRR